LTRPARMAYPGAHGYSHKADAARQLGIAPQHPLQVDRPGQLSPTSDGLIDQAELVRVAAYVDTLKERTRTSADTSETSRQLHVRPLADVRRYLSANTKHRHQRTSADV